VRGPTQADAPGSSPPAPAPQAQPQPGVLLVLNFLAVYFLWGGTFFAMRLGVESFPPLLLAGIRHLATGLLLYPLLRWKAPAPDAPQWKTAAVSGVLLLGANGAVCWAERTVPSGIAALLVATITLWMVILDWLRPGGHKPSNRVLLGIALGFLGMIVLVGPARLGSSGRVDPAGAALLVMASLAWAGGSLYSKHGSMPASPLLGVAMQGLCGGGALWILALLTGELRGFHLSAVSTRSWFAVVYLFVFGSCIGFSSYLYILKKSTAAKVGTYAFVNPVVALAIGRVFGGESLTLRTLGAASVILTAVVLVITAPHRDPAEAAEVLPAPGEA